MLLGLLAVARPNIIAAELSGAPSLAISQLRITSSNGQFITLYNSTDATVDLGKYQLQYFNSYDMAKVTSSRLIALSGTLPPHGYYVINDGLLTMCYKQIVESVSLGLSSTAGMIELLAFNQASLGSPVTRTLQDYVAWSKTAATGAQTMPSSTGSFLRREPRDSNNNPLITSPGSGSWNLAQQDINDPCKITSSPGAVSFAAGSGQLLPPTEPPVEIWTSGENVSDTTPAANKGLMSLQITELLPNPDGTGNDASDEYIELYNPNAAVFDLSGYKLETGITSARSYTFPAGTSIPGLTWLALYSESTGLSLSNTASEARFLDASDKIIVKTEAYANAKDGQAWSLANGKWYWSTASTPNASNIIKEPLVTKKSKAAVSKTSSRSASVKAKGATQPKPKTSPAFINEEPSTTPVRIRTLALVAGLALLYGAYEYRTDLANRFRRIRNYVGNRGRNRP